MAKFSDRSAPETISDFLFSNEIWCVSVKLSPLAAGKCKNCWNVLRYSEFKLLTSWVTCSRQIVLLHSILYLFATSLAKKAIIWVLLGRHVSKLHPLLMVNNEGNLFLKTRQKNWAKIRLLIGKCQHFSIYLSNIHFSFHKSLFFNFKSSLLPII